MSKIKRIMFLRSLKIPPEGDNRLSASPIPPLGMGVITAALRKKGYIVFQDDLNIKLANNIEKIDLDLSCLKDIDCIYKYLIHDDIQINKLIKKILNSQLEKFDPDLILITKPDSLHNTSAIRMMLILSKYLKKRFKVPVVIGGTIHLSNICEFSLRNSINDFFIFGPGEKSIIKLIQILDSKKRDFSLIKGLCYIKDGKIIKNDEDRPELSIIPDFSGLPFKYYKWPKSTKENTRVIPYRFTHGCNNSCAFCLSSNLIQGCNLLDIDLAIKSIKYLKEKYNSRYFLFMNNHINISKEYAKKFCKKLIEQNLNILWTDCVYPDNLDDELLILMKKSGCIRLIFGFESGSNRLLSLMRKKIDHSHLSMILKKSHELGIWNGVEVIVGFPTESKKDLNATIRFLKNNKYFIDEMYIEAFKAYKSSSLGQNPEKYKMKNLSFRHGKEFILNSDYFYYFGGRYDVIRGYKWNKTRKRIIAHHKILLKKFADKLPLLYFEQTNLLFFLYNRFKEKKYVDIRYKMILRKKEREQLFNIKNVFWKLKKKIGLENEY